MKERQKIEIEWDDIAGSGTWDDIKKDYTEDVVHCRTLGYCLKSNRKTIVLASTITDKGRCCDRTIIPRSVVRSLKTLE